MRWLRRALSGGGALLRRRHAQGEMDEELRSYLEAAIAENMRAGMAREDAVRAAHVALGSLEAVKDHMRDVGWEQRFENLLRDLRYAIVTLRRSPGFALVAIITLALGIGANTAIFTLLDAVIFKPLPVPAANELLTLYENAPDGVPEAAGGTGRYLRFSFPRFDLLERALGSDGSLAAVTRSASFLVRLPGSTEPSRLRGQLVSRRYFDTLRVSAARGRVLNADDGRPDGVQPVAVVSDGFWRRALGASDAAIGQTLVINGVPVTVVGVTPPGFVGLWSDNAADVWLPLTLQPALRYENNVSSYGNVDRSQPWLPQDGIAWLNLVGRVSPSQRARATALLTTANQQGSRALAETLTGSQGRDDLLAHTLVVAPFASGFSGLRARYSDALFALTALVGITLLIACINIANLFLTRAAGRAREMGIRISLGATTGRLIQQGLMESVLLALLGGAVGFGVGIWTSGVLAHQVLGTTGALPPVFSPDARVLSFTTGLALLTAMVFGLAPAVRAIRMGREAGLAINQRQTIGRLGMKGMRPLVAGQLALSVIVASGAVLLGRTLINITRIDPGFDGRALVTISFDADTSGYTRDRISALNRSLVTAVRALPDVTSAAVSRCGLVTNCSSTSGVKIEGSGESVQLQNNWVGPQYFSTTGIALVSGREFDERDTERSARVAIISDSVARRYFAGQDPIGRRLGFDQLDTEIVGVARDVRAVTLHEPPVPMVYFAIEQPAAFRTSPRDLDVRVAQEPENVISMVREAIRRAEPGLLIDSVGTMSDRVTRDVSRERIVATLAGTFAALALFLAALGLYGVLSYTVAARTQEIGVRIALGARASAVATMVAYDALRVLAFGAAAGVLGSWFTSRLLATLLFDVSASDPATYALVVGMLTAVAMLAAFLPARRAARVDPVIALRAE
jgi:predicted permease